MLGCQMYSGDYWDSKVDMAKSPLQPFIGSSCSIL